MTELTTGTEAPQFSLPVGSSTVRLTDLRGKIVVLYFYPKDDTQGCTAEAIDFSRLHGEFSEAGAVVIGVSPDSLAKHEKFTRKHELTVPLGSDEDLETVKAYGVWAEKSMYGKTFMGVVRSTFLIDREGKIARIWPKVKVAGHAAEVLEAVKSL